MEEFTKIDGMSLKKMALVSRKGSEMVASMWGGITWKTSIFIFQTNSIIQLS